MKQKKAKTLTKNQKLLKKATDRTPTPSQERTALKKLFSKDPDLYFKKQQEQTYQDIKNAKSTKKSTKTKSTKKSTKSKSKKK